MQDGAKPKGRLGDTTGLTAIGTGGSFGEPLVRVQKIAGRGRSHPLPKGTTKGMANQSVPVGVLQGECLLHPSRGIHRGGERDLRGRATLGLHPRFSIFTGTFFSY